MSNRRGECDQRKRIIERNKGEKIMPKKNLFKLVNPFIWRSYCHFVVCFGVCFRPNAWLNWFDENLHHEQFWVYGKIGSAPNSCVSPYSLIMERKKESQRALLEASALVREAPVQLKVVWLRLLREKFIVLWKSQSVCFDQRALPGRWQIIYTYEIYPHSAYSQ